MQQIDLDELVVASHTNEEVIKWLASTSAWVLHELYVAIEEGNMGKVGRATGALVHVVGVSKELNQKVNGKKSNTVL